MDQLAMDGAEDLASLLHEEIDETDRSWTIGELAREYDVTLRAMRFYEAKGLLKPKRDGSIRLYDAENRRRLQVVLRAKKVGFSLVEIRDLLGSTGRREPIERRKASLRERLLRQTELLETQRAEAEAALTAIGEEISALDRSAASA